MFKKFFISFIICFLILIPCLSLATQDFGLKEGREIQGLAKDEPGTYAGKVLNYVLGLVGVILITIIIYGGFMYATAAGNQQRLESAKKVLVYAIIGTIIVALAWAISYFILRALTPAPEEVEKVLVKDKDKIEGIEKDLPTYPIYEDKMPICSEVGSYCETPVKIEYKNKGIKVKGMAPSCCKSLVCNQETQKCEIKCAKAGEEPFDFYGPMPCCQGLELKSGKCIKPKSRL